MTETEALRVALDANTEQSKQLAAMVGGLLELLPVFLVLVVAGLGVSLGRLAGGAVHL